MPEMALTVPGFPTQRLGRFCELEES